MLQSLQQEISSHDIWRLSQNRIIVQCNKNFIHTLKQFLHQYHKTLALCDIKGDLPSSFSFNIACSLFCGIDAIADNYNLTKEASPQAT